MDKGGEITCAEDITRVKQTHKTTDAENLIKNCLDEQRTILNDNKDWFCASKRFSAEDEISEDTMISESDSLPDKPDDFSVIQTYYYCQPGSRLSDLWWTTEKKIAHLVPYTENHVEGNARNSSYSVDHTSAVTPEREVTSKMEKKCQERSIQAKAPAQEGTVSDNNTPGSQEKICNINVDSRKSKCDKQSHFSTASTNSEQIQSTIDEDMIHPESTATGDVINTTTNTYRDLENMKCKTCEKTLSSMDHLIVHILTVHRQKLYFCNICQKEFTHEHILSDHMRIHKGIVACRICHKGFLCLDHLEKHKSVHEDDNQLNSCYSVDHSSVATSEAVTSKMEKKCHERSLQAKAPVQEATVSYNNTLGSQEEKICKINRDSRKAKCYKQSHSSKASNDSELMQSQTDEIMIDPENMETGDFIFWGKVQDGKASIAAEDETITMGMSISHTCKFCSQRFITGDILERHVERFHGDDCSGTSEVLNSELRKDYQTQRDVPWAADGGSSSRHSNKSSPALNTTTKSYKDLEPMKCKTCEKTLPSMDHLIVHMLTVHRQKLYSCNICQKEFTHEHILSNHMRIHKGIVTCTICHKGFQCLDELEIHKSIHKDDNELNSCYSVDDSSAATPEREISSKMKQECQERSLQATALVQECTFSANNTLDSQEKICNINGDARKAQYGKQCRSFKESTGTELTESTTEEVMMNTENTDTSDLICSEKIAPTCKFCSRRFITWDILERHIERFHYDDNSGTDDKFHTEFKRQSLTQSHVSLRVDERIVTCTVCLKEFRCLDELEKHQSMHKDDNQLNSCYSIYHTSAEAFERETTSEMEKKCQERSSQIKTPAHETSVSANDTLCSKEKICKKNIHLRITKCYKPSHSCKASNDSELKQSTTDEVLMSMENMETDDVMCSGKSHEKETFIATEDETTTTEMSVTCKHCSQIFVTGDILERHIERFHGDDKSGTGRVYNTKLQKRSQTKSQITFGADEGIYSQLANGHMEAMKCKTCEKTLPSMDHLIVHMLTVHRQKLYSCNICQKEFTHEHILSNHMRIHKGIVTCTICHKGFKCLEELEKHQSIHKDDAELI